PVGGGEVAIPSDGNFSGDLIFDPGAAPGTEIALVSSTASPAALPLVGLTSPDAQTEPFFHLLFSVSQPVPLSLLEGVRLRGRVPADHEQYHADLFDLGRDGILPQGDGSAD